MGNLCLTLTSASFKSLKGPPFSSRGKKKRFFKFLLDIGSWMGNKTCQKAVLPSLGI